jgi:lipid-binding SYLF domain-containing protein
MTTICSHAQRLGELMSSMSTLGSREQLSEQVLASTKGLLYFRGVSRGRLSASATHGIFIKRTCSGWSSPAGVHMLQGTLEHDGFDKQDLVVLVLDDETVRAFEQVGEVGFDAGGPHTMMPGVVRGCQPPSTKASLSYSIIDNKAFVAAYLERAVVQFRVSSNEKFYGREAVLSLGSSAPNASPKRREYARAVLACELALDAFFGTAEDGVAEARPRAAVDAPHARTGSLSTRPPAPSKQQQRRHDYPESDVGMPAPVASVGRRISFDFQ